MLTGVANGLLFALWTRLLTDRVRMSRLSVQDRGTGPEHTRGANQ